MIIEVITLISRFYFGLESTQDTRFIGSFTGGLRIHHGYIGVLLMLFSAIHLKTTGNFSDSKFSIGHWLFALGLGLLCSDMIHHFLVLWVVTGDPRFDLVYPKL